MTWHSAHELMNTRSCAVPGCTGLVYRSGDLCDWHERNGTPDQYRSRRADVSPDKLRELERRVDDLDRQIDRLTSERRRVARRLLRLRGEPL